MSENYKKSEYTSSAIYGAISGILAKSSMAPLDRLKIIFQTNNTKFSWINLFTHSKTLIQKEGGYLKLWKGNGIQVLRMGPYTSLAYSFQKFYKNKLIDEHGKLSTVNGYIVGLLTGLSSSLIVYPLDTLRCRVAIDVSKDTTWNLVKTNIKTQGFKSLYNGFTVSTLSMMPYSSLSWGTLYFLMDKFKKYNVFPEDSPLNISVGTAISVCFAQTVVYPFDVWRRRIQSLPVDKNISTQNISSQFKQNINVFKIIIKEKALFKGLTINFFKTPIVNSISLTLFAIMEKSNILNI